MANRRVASHRELEGGGGARVDDPRPEGSGCCGGRPEDRPEEWARAPQGTEGSLGSPVVQGSGPAHLVVGRGGPAAHRLEGGGRAAEAGLRSGDGEWALRPGAGSTDG